MKSSQLLLATLREAPADAEIISHQLMLRAGLIRRLAAGIYTWLPLGLRVLRKVEKIVREEMDRSGAQELLMSGVLPEELWQETGRWDQYGPELLRFNDRHDRAFCLGPTHEEAITDLVRREIRSYKQLPVNFYQIQTKFRDEIRPRFGIMRAREFLMKDAYSFHMDQESLEDTYHQMYQTYCRIFDRINLEYRAVVADSGNIGGSTSHEFHVLAESGEDAIAYTDDGEFAANIEMVACPAQENNSSEDIQALTEVSTPGQHTIEQVSAFLNVTADKCLKTLIVHGEHDELVALVLRGDHELNRIKTEKLEKIKTPLTMATPAQVREALNCETGSIGPVNIQLNTIADTSAVLVSNFVCGANKNETHLTGCNWGRDLEVPEVADIRNTVEGDLNAEGKVLKVARGIEVGHIFQLGKKYSTSMNTTVLDEKGHAVTLTMGCYGIGVSRIVAAAIEQNNDDRGIIWPEAIAPFQVALLPMHMHKSQRLREAVDDFYSSLIHAGIDVLLDDRRERPGVMFADMELLGIPHRLVFSERGLDNGTIEYKGRTDENSIDIELGSAIQFIKDKSGKE